MGRLEPASTTTSLLPGGVGGDGGAVLNAADLHASTSESPEGALGPGSGGLGPVAAGGAELDVQSSDSKGLNIVLIETIELRFHKKLFYRYFVFLYFIVSLNKTEAA